jgi:hypothetical protein
MFESIGIVGAAMFGGAMYGTTFFGDRGGLIGSAIGLIVGFAMARLVRSSKR